MTMRCGVLLAAGMLVASCKPAEPESSQCVPGARGCPCNTGGECDEGLACLDGFCVPASTDCERGSEGCACSPDGACAAEGERMLTCRGNVCVAVRAPAGGALGGACGTDSDCVSADGEPLACVRGACERSNCPSGSLGCPCGPVGFCDPVEGQPARCVDGVCALGACAEGSCAATLHRVALVVGGAGVAACDVLVELGAARLRRVRFPAEVMGTSVRQPRYLGFSLLGRGEAALQGTVADLELAGGGGSGSGYGNGSDDAAPPRLVLARCFDAEGVEIAEPLVALEGR